MSRDAGIADNLRGIGIGLSAAFHRGYTEAANKYKPLVITVLGFKSAVNVLLTTTASQCVQFISFIIWCPLTP